MSAQSLTGLARLHQVYDQYVKPVEQTHLGEYALVRPNGEIVFATNLPDLVEKTQYMVHRDNCLFRVGEISAFNIW